MPPAAQSLSKRRASFFDTESKLLAAKFPFLTGSQIQSRVTKKWSQMTNKEQKAYSVKSPQLSPAVASTPKQSGTSPKPRARRFFSTPRQQRTPLTRRVKTPSPLKPGTAPKQDTFKFDEEATSSQNFEDVHKELQEVEKENAVKKKQVDIRAFFQSPNPKGSRSKSPKSTTERVLFVGEPSTSSNKTRRGRSRQRKSTNQNEVSAKTSVHPSSESEVEDKPSTSRSGLRARKSASLPNTLTRTTNRIRESDSPEYGATSVSPKKTTRSSKSRKTRKSTAIVATVEVAAQESIVQLVDENQNVVVETELSSVRTSPRTKTTLNRSSPTSKIPDVSSSPDSPVPNIETNCEDLNRSLILRRSESRNRGRVRKSISDSILGLFDNPGETVAGGSEEKIEEKSFGTPTRRNPGRCRRSLSFSHDEDSETSPGRTKSEDTSKPIVPSVANEMPRTQRSRSAKTLADAPQNSDSGGVSSSDSTASTAAKKRKIQLFASEAEFSDEKPVAAEEQHLLPILQKKSVKGSKRKRGQTAKANAITESPAGKRVKPTRNVEANPTEATEEARDKTPTAAESKQQKTRGRRTRSAPGKTVEEVHESPKPSRTSRSSTRSKAVKKVAESTDQKETASEELAKDTGNVVIEVAGKVSALSDENVPISAVQAQTFEAARVTLVEEVSVNRMKDSNVTPARTTRSRSRSKVNEANEMKEPAIEMVVDEEKVVIEKIDNTVRTSVDGNVSENKTKFSDNRTSAEKESKMSSSDEDSPPAKVVVRIPTRRSTRKKFIHLPSSEHSGKSESEHEQQSEKKDIKGFMSASEISSMKVREGLLPGSVEVPVPVSKEFLLSKLQLEPLVEPDELQLPVPVTKQTEVPLSLPESSKKTVLESKEDGPEACIQFARSESESAPLTAPKYLSFSSKAAALPEAVPKPEESKAPDMETSVSPPKLESEPPLLECSEPMLAPELEAPLLEPLVDCDVERPELEDDEMEVDAEKPVLILKESLPEAHCDGGIENTDEVNKQRDMEEVITEETSKPIVEAKPPRRKRTKRRRAKPTRNGRKRRVVDYSDTDSDEPQNTRGSDSEGLDVKSVDSLTSLCEKAVEKINADEDKRMDQADDKLSKSGLLSLTGESAKDISILKDVDGENTVDDEPLESMDYGGGSSDDEVVISRSNLIFHDSQDFDDSVHWSSDNASVENVVVAREILNDVFNQALKTPSYTDVTMATECNDELENRSTTSTQSTENEFLLTRNTVVMDTDDAPANLEMSADVMMSSSKQASMSSTSDEAVLLSPLDDVVGNAAEAEKTNEHDHPEENVSNLRRSKRHRSPPKLYSPSDEEKATKKRNSTQTCPNPASTLAGLRAVTYSPRTVTLYMAHPKVREKEGAVIVFPEHDEKGAETSQAKQDKKVVESASGTSSSTTLPKVKVTRDVPVPAKSEVRTANLPEVGTTTGPAKSAEKTANIPKERMPAAPAEPAVETPNLKPKEGTSALPAKLAVETADLPKEGTSAAPAKLAVEKANLPEEGTSAAPAKSAVETANLPKEHTRDSRTDLAKNNESRFQTSKPQTSDERLGIPVGPDEQKLIQRLESTPRQSRLDFSKFLTMVNQRLLDRKAADKVAQQASAASAAQGVNKEPVFSWAPVYRARENRIVRAVPTVRAAPSSAVKGVLRSAANPGKPVDRRVSFYSPVSATRAGPSRLPVPTAAALSGGLLKAQLPTPMPPTGNQESDPTTATPSESDPPARAPLDENLLQKPTLTSNTEKPTDRPEPAPTQGPSHFSDHLYQKTVLTSVQPGDSQKLVRTAVMSPDQLPDRGIPVLEPGLSKKSAARKKPVQESAQKAEPSRGLRSSTQKPVSTRGTRSSSHCKMISSTSTRRGQYKLVRPSAPPSGHPTSTVSSASTRARSKVNHGPQTAATPGGENNELDDSGYPADNEDTENSASENDTDVVSTEMKKSQDRVMETAVMDKCTPNRREEQVRARTNEYILLLESDLARIENIDDTEITDEEKVDFEVISPELIEEECGESGIYVVPSLTNVENVDIPPSGAVAATETCSGTSLSTTSSFSSTSNAGMFLRRRKIRASSLESELELIDLVGDDDTAEEESLYSDSTVKFRNQDMEKVRIMSQRMRQIVQDESWLDGGSQLSLSSEQNSELSQLLASESLEALDAEAVENLLAAPTDPSVSKEAPPRPLEDAPPGGPGAPLTRKGSGDGILCDMFDFITPPEETQSSDRRFFRNDPVTQTTDSEEPLAENQFFV